MVLVAGRSKVQRPENAPKAPTTLEKWCEFPTEIKLNCIKTMDFETRFALRSTARMERSLVDSQKYPFTFFHMFRTGTSVYTSSLSTSTFPKRNETLETDFVSIELGEQEHIVNTVIPVIKFMLQIGEIFFLTAEFEQMPEVTEKICHELKDIPPIRTVTFTTFHANQEVTLFFLKKLDPNKIESITLDCSKFNEFPCDELVAIPAITSAQLLEMICWRDPEAKTAPKIVKSWIDSDAQIGKIMSLAPGKKKYVHETFKHFEEEFENRIVFKKHRKMIRIRTNNEENHAILYSFCSYAPGFYCAIVPADLENNCFHKFLRNYHIDCDSDSDDLDDNSESQGHDSDSSDENSESDSDDAEDEENSEGDE